MEIDGRKYDYDIIIFGKKVKSWWRKYGHLVTIEDLNPILSRNPDSIIFGTGEAGIMKVPSEIVKFLESKGKKVFVKKTHDAVKMFNEMINLSDQKVLGAFHLTC
jgi:hypothetical protein